MKHRGRHRRRGRGRALRATLTGAALALTAAATMISVSQAEVGDDHGGLKPLTASAETERLRLTEHRVPGRWLRRLAASMGDPVDVGAVLDSADRSLRTSADCADEEREALPVAPAATRSYCWSESDTRGWSPGAVTTSGDADDDGHWGADRVILSAWSSEDEGAGRGLARISFVNAGSEAGSAQRSAAGTGLGSTATSASASAPDDGPLPYSSALLAVPVDGGRDYRALSSPVSGMVWYQDKVLVTTAAGDRNALYVYDLDRIQRTTDDGDAVGRVPGGWSAHGHPFVLPAVATYELPDTPGAARPEALSLDRQTAPDSLVASESVPADEDRSTRLWRYAFSTDPDRTGLVATDGTGRVEAQEAYETRAKGVRGVLSYRPAGAVRPDWYLSGTVAAPDERGTLWRQETDGARATECGADRSHHCWSGQAGSLSYWPATGEVWSQTGRTLFATPLTSVDDSLG
ncbi:hypothetical protein [Streptomyces ziwulingensis]|uniref:Secreted protein n=1 Tax=Streptomyces ziwulingensis TaxID=1045501 RepID=A0ABP9CLW8_9ACTN